MADVENVIIIGSGPAGYTAALYTARANLDPLVIEGFLWGGLLQQTTEVENYPGFKDGIMGPELMEQMRGQAQRFGAELLTTREAVALDVRGSARVVRFDDGAQIAAHTVLLATGVSYRRLAAPGLDELTGRGVFYGSSTTEGPQCTGLDVYVVGGANSAGQAAVYFSRFAKSVTLLARGARLESSMSHYLVERLRGIDNITVRTTTEVVGAEGEEHLERLVLRDGATGLTEVVDAGWLFVFIGAAPPTDWLDGVVRRDSRGFVLSGPDLVVDGRRPPGWPLDRDPFLLETSVPGVFVAGDVRSASVKRVASAVGEGAMAVTLVHRYLEAQ